MSPYVPTIFTIKSKLLSFLNNLQIIPALFSSLICIQNHISPYNLISRHTDLLPYPILSSCFVSLSLRVVSLAGISLSTSSPNSLLHHLRLSISDFFLSSRKPLLFSAQSRYTSTWSSQNCLLPYGSPHNPALPLFHVSIL